MAPSAAPGTADTCLPHSLTEAAAHRSRNRSDAREHSTQTEVSL
jgi:hypothetical protein